MKLILPKEKYLNSYKQAFLEYKQQRVDKYAFYNANQIDVIKLCYNNRKGVGLKDGWVPQTTYWLIDGEEFIGEISIRHYLTDSLLRYGGHIGYGIRYSKWNSGYGTKMLALALKKAKHMGLNKVLITCDEDNIGSAKVIENNGGVLENIIENTIEGKKIYTKRYWIEL